MYAIVSRDVGLIQLEIFHVAYETKRERDENNLKLVSIYIYIC